VGPDRAGRPVAPPNPAKILVYGFASVIAVGTLLLMLPVATAAGRQTDLLTAFFTSTSAVCVTGLIVVDTGQHWSAFGQGVILGLIQVGGLGIMSMSTVIALILGRKVTLRERLLIRESTGQLTMEGMVRLVRLVIITTLLFEVSGAVLLTARWAQDYSLAEATWLGIFHSVSAFNNAGFSLFSESLKHYAEDPTVNIVVITLLLAGGVGFAVLAEIYRWMFRAERRFSLHAKIVLSVSGALLLIGAILIFFMELTNPDTLGGLSGPGKMLASIFTSATPRTAGFNTIPTGSLRHNTLFFIVLFMFIGGSSGSTAGGIKTTTFFSIAAAVRSTIRNREDAEMFRRRLASDIVYQALSIVVLAALVVFLVTLILLITERADLVDCLFEAMSAFGTVGLSMGLTPDLSRIGRVVVIFTMFTGRLGPLTLALALGQDSKRRGNYRHPREDIMIG